MNRPRLLDLFCGAGGAAMGYHRAGFDVVGVDNRPQPRYPFEFIQADAIEILDALWVHETPFSRGRFDAIHASAPCRDHTPLTSVAGTDGTGWLLGATRRAALATSLPFVLENVPGSPMRVDLMLCGKMFALRVKRHRWFEIHGAFVTAIPHAKHTVPTATRERRKRWAEGWDVSVTGDVGTYLAPEAMGIDWMTGNELSQAIPPAYTEYIGAQLLAHLAAVTA